MGLPAPMPPCCSLAGSHDPTQLMRSNVKAKCKIHRSSEPAAQTSAGCDAGRFSEGPEFDKQIHHVYWCLSALSVPGMADAWRWSCTVSRHVCIALWCRLPPPCSTHAAAWHGLRNCTDAAKGVGFPILHSQGWEARTEQESGGIGGARGGGLWLGGGATRRYCSRYDDPVQPKMVTVISADWPGEDGRACLQFMVQFIRGESGQCSAQLLMPFECFICAWAPVCSQSRNTRGCKHAAADAACAWRGRGGC